MIYIKPIDKKKKQENSIIYLVNNAKDINTLDLLKQEKEYVLKVFTAKEDDNWCLLNRYDYWLLIIMAKAENNNFKELEKLRKWGDKVYNLFYEKKEKNIDVYSIGISNSLILAFCEGFELSTYQFKKYKSLNKDKEFVIEEINLYTNESLKEDVNELNNIKKAVFLARDLVNEPNSGLTAIDFAEIANKYAQLCNFNIDILEKNKIEALKMNGLLAVNKGSAEPPTFTFMEWKPKKCVNTNPIIIVGKGVMFDTGGISLKPSAKMDEMKCDMSGAAAVLGAMVAISLSKLNVWLIGLIPATDNKPDGSAIVPGDIITYADGKTVEVLSTDAEGRLILADALLYANKFKPSLVIDIATLTGAAHAAIGKYGIVAMQNNADVDIQELKVAGNSVYERIVEFPFWEEYEELVKSDIADFKNLGGQYAGAITAGKFLQNFTNYPWIHLDIAGPAYLDKKDSYRPSGGTGIGVRLFYEFIKNRVKNAK